MNKSSVLQNRAFPHTHDSLVILVAPSWLVYTGYLSYCFVLRLMIFLKRQVIIAEVSYADLKSDLSLNSNLTQLLTNTLDITGRTSVVLLCTHVNVVV